MCRALLSTFFYCSTYTAQISGIKEEWSKVCMHAQKKKAGQGVAESCHKKARGSMIAKLDGDHVTHAEHNHAVAAKTHTRRPLPISDHDVHGGCGSAPVPVHTRVHAECHTPMTRRLLNQAPAQTQFQPQLRTQARPSYENTDPYLPHQIRSGEATHLYLHPDSSPLLLPCVPW